MRGSAHVLALIANNGCVVLNSMDLHKLDFSSWSYVTFNECFGLFNWKIIPNGIFLLDAAPDEDADYVLLHEFGHFISSSLRLGLHELLQDGRFKEFAIDHWNLTIQEEYRADQFALILMAEMGIAQPSWLDERRLTQYKTYISKERMAELDVEVAQMIRRVSGRKSEVA